EHFLGYASQLVQTWDAARRDLPLPDGFRNLLNLGGEVSLCNPLLLNWMRRLREAIPGHAVRVEIGQGADLLKQLEQGALDAALVYQPEYWPGLQVEQLLEEKLVMVRSVLSAEPYLYVDWGPDFRSQHDAALPDRAKAALACNLGPLALQYIMQNGGSGYFRTRVVSSYLDGGTLQRVEQAPEFAYPTYLVYSRERLSPTLRHAFQLLREVVREDSDWSQRWDYVI
ncbi:substrate-binding domain-containing protein, partial [Pseudomonas aeruginosa]|nr:substrate-binding domain-containing protein [Pseudomonas aeruginosa]